MGNSLNKKILMLMLLISVVVFSLQIYFIIGSYREDLSSEAESHLISRIEQETENMNSDFLRIDQSAKGLSSLIAKSRDTDMNLDYIKDFITEIDLVMGSGFWMEPYQYEEDEEFYGPYVHQEESEVLVTWEYSNEEYDYFTHDWYEAGRDSGESVWTEPYYDEVSDITMMTYSTPIFSDDEIIGVTSIDINLEGLQSYVENISIGDNGEAYLIADNGNFIVNPHIDEPGINIEDQEMSSLTDVASDILSAEGDQLNTAMINESEHFVSHADIGDTGLKLILTLPTEELGIQNQVYYLIIISVISIFAFLLILYFMIKNLVINPINETKDFTAVIAEGDFTKEISQKYINRKDEIGDLASNFDSMQKNLKDIITNIMSVADNLATSSEELSASSEEISTSTEDMGKSVQEIASGAEEQSAQVEETKSNVDSLKNEIDDIGYKSTKMNKQANNVIENIELGNESINNSINQVKDVKNRTLGVTEQINKLGELSKKIGEITDIINDISSQTNLLALNAAIEAARAGEAGQGFSVVAEEIRKLAEETSNSTEQITSLINEIQEGVQKTVAEVDDTNNSVDNSVSVIESTADNFYKTNQEMENLSQYIKEISLGVNTMNENSEFVINAVNEISQVSQEAAQYAENVATATKEQGHSTNEIVEATSELAEMAEKLNDIVNQFKI
ncbi:methyl-accepting chemotaxis protein [Natranaerobius thermophilus]|uniref:Methyl-accepting chemotaxis sensory transducer with Cache sensor n=1 Tax=Natranaerobius thermophilus (strain ATCC BAA-1301 / DSM 18059 / JW/NM-WN-LF) TaxID=457570 RepID=B2A1U0_NATTJ|nr:methyl-accepting chemotaxis protein [Natranaerobius thermophilus]ACB86137.1 methyl-accepting chemotaxis sensory transducer with Cache sensor [Natranaerobius thermophilus JW/NM-WN-LF]